MNSEASDGVFFGMLAEFNLEFEDLPDQSTK